MIDVFGMAVIGVIALIGARKEAVGSLVVIAIIAAWCLGRFAA